MSDINNQLENQSKQSMKAIVLNRYGSPEDLQVQDIPKPSPAAHEVLVKIHATAINDYDWSIVRGKPYLYRLMFGLRRPKMPVAGMELAGVVEAVGDQVSQFQVGDAVYGDTSEYGFGTFAEYMCIHEKALILKPNEMSFEQATAIPHAAALAYQGLVDAGQIKSGQRVLINGAGGGVGTFGLQIAKTYGAEVTGVDTGDKLQRMRALGFDQVIDYKKVDFTKTGQRYDLILDAKTKHAPRAYLRVLHPEGRYVTVGGDLHRLLQLVVSKAWIARTTKKHLQIVALKANKDLDKINALFAAGIIKPLIDGPYPLEKIPWAISYFGAGQHHGKVVIAIK